MSIDRKAVFALIRQGMGGLTQEQVNELDAIFTRWEIIAPAPTLDKTKFFTIVRRDFGRLSNTMVAGCEAILDKWIQARGVDYRHLAYILATVYHEAKFNLAIREIGRGKGKAYGKPDPVTGHIYYGRGPVQITWKENYKKLGDLLGVDLVKNPDMVLQPEIGVIVLFEGMYRGISKRGDFTGVSLEDYFTTTKEDPVNARRIVNGTDKASTIAGYYWKFKAALKEAGMRTSLFGTGAAIVINDILPKVLQGQMGMSTPAVQNIAEKVRDAAMEEIPAEVAPKSPLKSMTVLSGGGTVITSLAAAWLAYQSGDMNAAIASVMAAFTGVMAIIGRFRATQVVTTK